MEKKSTKIAYFVALGIFVVLLAILGITFKDAPILIEGATTPFAGTFWSLLPPIVAIVLALISKEVYSSLFLGCLVGALLVSNFAPWETLVQLWRAITVSSPPFLTPATSPSSCSWSFWASWST